MLDQIVFPVITLPAEGAPKGLLPRVDPLVRGELLLGPQPLPALATLGPLPGVDLLMLPAQPLLPVGLPTVAALERLLPRVDLLVGLEAALGGEPCPALGAGERLLPGVSPQVLAECAPAAEGAPTLGTLMGPILGVDALV